MLVPKKSKFKKYRPIGRMEQHMQRPYIICHMVISLDGKVTGDFLTAPECEKGTDIYYEVNRNFAADAFACGRVTMEGSFTEGYYPDLSSYEGIDIPMGDYIADTDAKFYAVAFDRNGKLGWKTPMIVDDDPGYGDAHIIEVLMESVDKRYLAYLRRLGISYIFGGKEKMDLPLVLTKLKKHFGIEKMLLEGGSILNGAFLSADIIDELSLVYVPIIAGDSGKPLFAKGAMKSFRMRGSAIKDDTVWVRMEADRGAPEEDAP